MQRNCSTARVRRSEWVRLGTPNVTCFEPPSIEVEQFLAMLRFENRGKLAELPQDLMEVHNGFTFSP
jgi:hypothetical protein